jgi:hypothetical protein
MWLPQINAWNEFLDAGWKEETRVGADIVSELWRAVSFKAPVPGKTATQRNSSKDPMGPYKYSGES